MKTEELELKSAMKVDKECPKRLWYNVGESGKKNLIQSAVSILIYILYLQRNLRKKIN